MKKILAQFTVAAVAGLLTFTAMADLTQNIPFTAKIVSGSGCPGASCGLFFAPFFPLGLAIAVGKLIQHFSPHTTLKSDGPAFFIAAYSVYIVLFLVFCSIRNRKWYWLACTILFCLLLVNVSGCHYMSTHVGPTRIE